MFGIQTGAAVFAYRLYGSGVDSPRIDFEVKARYRF